MQLGRMPTSYFVPRLCSIWQNGDGYTKYTLAPHAEMCTRSSLRRQFSQSSYCIHATTYGCIFVNMYRIVCQQNWAFQPYYFSHINSGSFHTGPFIFTHLFSPIQLSVIPPVHMLPGSQWESGLICWRLDASGRSPSFVPLQSQSSFRVAQVCTGHTRGCLAFMGSVSHSLVWRVHTGILLEGIVKGFGSIPPKLPPCRCPSSVLSPLKELDHWSNLYGRTSGASLYEQGYSKDESEGCFFLSDFVTESQVLRRPVFAIPL